MCKIGRCYLFSAFFGVVGVPRQQWFMSLQNVTNEAEIFGETKKELRGRTRLYTCCHTVLFRFDVIAWSTFLSNFSIYFRTYSVSTPTVEIFSFQKAKVTVRQYTTFYNRCIDSLNLNLVSWVYEKKVWESRIFFNWWSDVIVFFYNRFKQAENTPGWHFPISNFILRQLGLFKKIFSLKNMFRIRWKSKPIPLVFSFFEDFTRWLVINNRTVHEYFYC